jgi:hypothetical protein
MGIYSPGDYTYTAIDSPSNSFRLRSDIHNDFDACAFAVVPKPTSAGDPHALAVHFIHIDDDLQDSAARFHNQLIRDPNVPPEYLFARFAYAVFKLIKPFVTTGTRRRLAVMAGGKEDWKTSIHDMELKKREGLFSSDVSRSSRTSKHEQASETESTIDDDYKLPGALSYQSTGDEETLNSTHVPQSIGCDEEAPLEPKHIGTSIWSSVWSGTTDKDVGLDASTLLYQIKQTDTKSQTHTSLSVLEYLDIKNPRIKYTGQRKYSIGDDSHLLLCPTQLQPWHEFNFDTIESIYKGALWRAAYEQNFSGPAYPTLSDQDCLITSEYTTACLITKWNGRIVQHALGHSGNQFNSCKWNAPRNPGDKRTSIFKYFCREEPSISTPQADSEITTSGVKTRHNADTTLTCPTNGASCPCSSIERLPKEYVLGSMWNSRDAISHGVTKMGQVKSSKRLSDKMYPIRKAYTYCARFGCRYGCILSTEEAFIFRIRPLSSQPGKLLSSLRPCCFQHFLQYRLGSTTDYGFFNERNKLLDGLSENGVMEYVSIPWQTPNDEDELNYNVALWFIHVLAANNFEVGWNYPPLVDEIVRENFCMEIPSTGGVDRQN